MRVINLWKPWLCLGLVLCALMLVAAPGAFAQATTGTISGAVTDQTGATVPGATVTVRHLDTNATRSFTTEADGRFSFFGLPVGRYELKVQLSGFSTYVNSGIVLVLNQVAVVNAELRPAAVAETVTVSEDAPILNTTNAEVGVRFDERRITDLPTSGQFGGGGGFRDVFANALSAPGVSQTNSGNSAFTTGTNFSVNGMRLRGNNFMIDGQDSNDPSIAGRQQLINNPDIVREFRLITNQFDAEYGRSAGSVVNVVTKSGTNQLHGSAFWFYNSNIMNALTNLDKAAGFTRAPKINEHQFGGTGGGPIIKNKAFFFGSYQKWTQRQLGSGTTINGVPTAAGQTLLQSTVGTRPQVAALLANLPAAQSPLTNTALYCVGGGALPTCAGGTLVTIPLGSLTNSTSSSFDDTQWSARIDYIFGKHQLGGRYLFDDSLSTGGGQITPPGLTSDNPARRQALTTFLVSNFTTRTLNEFRASWQRLASNTISPGAPNPPIPSIEIPEFGLTGFNAATSRTAIGLAVNLPQFRYNDTYQIQDSFSWTRGAHAWKFGLDLRRVDVNSFFLPTLRGRLNYPTTQPAAGTLPAGAVSIQNFVDDIASVTDINLPLPGGKAIVFYKWYDYFFFAQDTWRVTPSFTLNYGVRYETPGNSIDSLVELNKSIMQANGGNPVFQLTPAPKRDTNNWQPRFGFSWNPKTRKDGIIGRLTGGDQFVVRGGYSRTNDYTFINISLNIASSFPFLAAASAPGANAYTRLATLQPNLSVTVPDCTNNTTATNCLTRTVVGADFRAPIAEQFSLEVQRALAKNYSLRVGYIGTKGTALFQTLDGNPRTLCDPIPATRFATTGVWTMGSCPRQDITKGVIRLRANAASSIYHALQVQLDRRFANGFSAGAHYTWSAFIDTASEVFNPSARGEVAVSQSVYFRRADRARSTYDRPHRFAVNFVWELPFFRNQQGWIGHVLGGWQAASSATLQSGSPFGALNGSDPTNANSGIAGLVGDPIRPNLNTTLNLSSMSIEEILAAGGRSLFSTLNVFVGGNSLANPPTNCTLNTGSTTVGTCLVPIANRFGNAGRNILRSDGIFNIDFSISKTTRITENHRIQWRMDMFNMTNTRNFGIPEARITSAAFGNQWSTDGGSRRIFMALRYVF